MSNDLGNTPTSARRARFVTFLILASLLAGSGVQRAAPMLTVTEIFLEGLPLGLEFSGFSFGRSLLRKANFASSIDVRSSSRIGRTSLGTRPGKTRANSSPP